ncbi:MAG: S8 family peptidase, partial [Bacteroidota bacterium]
AKNNIVITEMDFPPNPDYIQEVMNVAPVQVRNVSRWFNAISVTSTDSTVLETINQLPFVASSERVRRFNVQKPEAIGLEKQSGNDSLQLSMLDLDHAHRLNYKGQNIKVALFDSGYERADILPALASNYKEGRVKATIDMHDGDDFVGHHHHGTFVWSIMAADDPELQGASPKSDYYLFRTEVVGFETRVEEDNWVAAAEMADSLGLDIINSSLGYTVFENPEHSYTIEDMDGQTTRISRAATWAAERGMVVVTSAGNLGDNTWGIISAPADAPKVLSVGSVDRNENYSPFSSRGPTADGRVKPDVSAMGQQTSFAMLDSTIRQGNGTSFSSPLIASLAACLMQASPQSTAKEIRLAIIESAHLYPDNTIELGHGIPSFNKAFDLLSRWNLEGIQLILYPNPSSTEARLVITGVEDPEIDKIEIVDASGRLIREIEDLICTENRISVYFNTDDLAEGIYYVKAGDDVVRMMVQR